MPESVGPAQEILVLIEPTDRENLEPHLKEIFERILHTPQEEKIFRLQFGNVADFDRFENKRRKNIMVIAELDAPHATGGFLRNILGPEVQNAVRRNRSAVFWKEDVWAKEQLLLAVSGNDSAGLVENLRMDADRLYKRIEEARNERIRRLIYRYGERKDVTEQLGREFGWQVRVAFGYRILEAYPDSGFVVLTKEEPNRWLFVYWEDGTSPDELSEEWCIRKRDAITGRFSTATVLYMTTWKLARQSSRETWLLYCKASGKTKKNGPGGHSRVTRSWTWKQTGFTTSTAGSIHQISAKNPIFGRSTSWPGLSSRWIRLPEPCFSLEKTV